jgi:hypothetical protein
MLPTHLSLPVDFDPLFIYILIYSNRDEIYPIKRIIIGYSRKELPSSNCLPIRFGEVVLFRHMQMVNRPIIPWVTFSRIAWFVLVILVIGLFIGIIRLEYQALQVVCDHSACDGNQLSTEEKIALQSSGFSIEFYAVSKVLAASVSALVSLAVAVLIFWRAAQRGFALFVSITLLLFGVLFNPNPALLSPAYPFWGSLAQLLKDIGIGFLFIFLFLFPSGRFVPRWSGWVLLFWFIAVMSHSFGIVRFPEIANLLFFIGLLFGGIAAQIYRYLRISGPIERQQTKWFISGWVLFIVAVIVIILLGAIFPALTRPAPAGVLFWAAQNSILPLIFASIPASIGIAILRYRLLDIDVIIRRTLIYGSLTAILALVYLGSVIIIQGLFIRLTGRVQSELATVLTTLAIAALFTPLRRGIQTVIDRRFYRRKYDAERILAEFSRSLRDEVDLAALRERLLSVVEDALHPDHASLWLSKK